MSAEYIMYAGNRDKGMSHSDIFNIEGLISKGRGDLFLEQYEQEQLAFRRSSIFFAYSVNRKTSSPKKVVEIMKLTKDESDKFERVYTLENGK